MPDVSEGSRPLANTQARARCTSSVEYGEAMSDVSEVHLCGDG